MPSNKRKKPKTIKNKKKSRSTQKKMRGGVNFSNENSNENSTENEKNFNNYCMYIFGDPDIKIDKLEKNKKLSDNTFAKQEEKMGNDRYFVLCFWGFLPYFAFKTIDEMTLINKSQKTRSLF